MSGKQKLIDFYAETVRKKVQAEGMFNTIAVALHERELKILREEMEYLRQFTQDLSQEDENYYQALLEKKEQEIFRLEAENKSLREQIRVKKKPSRVKYSNAEKLKAIKEWEELDKLQQPMTVEEFLENRFGAEGGVLNVAKSTFYGWKKQLDIESE